MTPPEVVALLDAIEAEWETATYELVDAILMDDRLWPGDDNPAGEP